MSRNAVFSGQISQEFAAPVIFFLSSHPWLTALQIVYWLRSLSRSPSRSFFLSHLFPHHLLTAGAKVGRSVCCYYAAPAIMTTMFSSNQGIPPHLRHASVRPHCLRGLLSLLLLLSILPLLASHAPQRRLLALAAPLIDPSIPPFSPAYTSSLSPPDPHHPFVASSTVTPPDTAAAAPAAVVAGAAGAAAAATAGPHKPPSNAAEQAECRRRVAAEASSAGGGGGGRVGLGALQRQWVAWVKARNDWCQTVDELWAEAFGGRARDMPWLKPVRALGPDGVGMYTLCYFRRKHVSLWGIFFFFSYSWGLSPPPQRPLFFYVRKKNKKFF